ncbi:ectoine/hydroxyectoine ABC transporter permease subunit EhuC [Mesorhizobium sp.]|uniref:ectoine/hydroxyectoine ABC transporter permease subunit EhuC n=1 Tax=Mesorhizobium sp. TaxID=1871066 RepID=UPI000FE3FBB0|nr:ectoine/hydroxyectoine ABC transporter permease subunit EhuC [Mesorhizobium sp.]RWN48881.1 MAG: ectoine/hydroxyectoine ABC transporter permease subunit EhuC [Mesorhizobium sp.]RWN69013.1 MAG: ectoine/hydroxyectoine ABC transporter permease subunit EhuC [Mesorhizobium sp.]RWN69593.1 MAG: ectoine/hydroxyectoine ABC transporter permease subunit EhuC [Mesorhizobium sp.]RWN81234.1 MAG: ectoine/hydroxyectoine ABC transporter permease subunit EhuC [Mesorhizobium sp.]RWO05761.1 MAG: ectoine/hydroxy
MGVSIEGLFNIFISGLWVTLVVSTGGFILTVVIGVIGGSTLVWGGPVIRPVMRIYVEIFRGTSIFFQLFFIYFVLPTAGIYLPPLIAGMLALGLNSGAYLSETVRGSILAVPREQTEAAVALNLTLLQRIRTVILPQAIVIALPPLGNTAIEILKGSSLVSLIALNDLTFNAVMIRSHIGSSVGPLLALLLVYYLLSKTIDFGFRTIEARLARGLDVLRA